jgi:hypothetical protein
MPALSFELKPKGRGASVRKAKNRYQDSLRTPEERQTRAEPLRQVDLRAAHEEALAADTSIRRPVDLTATFARAAEDTSAGRAAGTRAASRTSRCRVLPDPQSAGGSVAAAMMISRASADC